MHGIDRLIRGLTSNNLAVAVVALMTAGLMPVLAAAQTPALRRPVALAVTWPTTGGVERSDGNGLVLDGGVASIDGSDQYGLSVLSVDEAQSAVRATYIDAWALNAPDAASCSITFRRVDRPLTQTQANALADSLASVELTTIGKDHPDLVKTGERDREGAAVTRYVDRFSWGTAEARVDGLSKTWLFVRMGKAYYANKICLSHTGLADLTVFDQLIGLNYRTGDAPIPVPGDVVPENPEPAPRISLPPPVGNIQAQTVEAQTLDVRGAEVEDAPGSPQPQATPPSVARAVEPMSDEAADTLPQSTSPDPVLPAPPASAEPAPSGSPATFAASPAAPRPTPSPTPDQARALGLTRSLNAGPPAS